MASTTTGSSWAQLRQQTRSLESQTETLFHTYSQFSSTSNISPTPTAEETSTESQLRSLLTQRESLIGQLTDLLTRESALTSSALKQNNLSRHREILLEHRRELTRLKSLISSARDRANLLSSVRADISAYRVGSGNDTGSAEAEYMLAERGRIESSNRMADGVLAQAYAINESFGIQQEMLANVNRRITGALGRMPGINGLIRKIGVKKRRDGIVLAAFIAFCLLMLLYFR